jgi:hypothetical protein
MMAITTVSQISALLPTSQRPFWAKSITQNYSSGVATSLFGNTGLPGQGATPSSGLGGDVPTSATTGALPFTNPTGGRLTYVGRLTGGLTHQTNAGSIALLLYDRLWHNSGIDATSTGAQTISANDAGAVHLTRPDANGASVEAWLQVYVAMGAGTPTVTLAYTDQDGNAETTGSSGALATTMPLGTTIPFQLASGDTGVRSIQTWTASGTFTSGTIGLVLRRLVTVCACWANQPQRGYDAVALGLPRVYDDACLEILFIPLANNTINGAFNVRLVQG